MPTLYFYLDKRQPRKDGSCSLKLAITHKRQTVYDPLDVFIKPDEWDADRQQVVIRPDRKFLNVIIKKRMSEGTLALQRIMLRSDADALTARQVLRMVLRGTDTADDHESEEYVLPVYNEYITLCRKPATTACYRASLKNLVEYEPDIDSLKFKDITVAWLRKYQQWLTDARGMEVNGANVYLRNLRTVFNFAINNQYTFARYPFRDIDMSTTEPDKRSVDWDVFLDWASAPVTDNRVYYRDLFMLSFYLCGIRPVDLLHVKKSQVEDGRLVYWPEKLNGRTKLSVKIEPEAWEIIRKYEGDEYLINVMESRKDYKAFMAHWNRALKAVGKDEKEYRTGQKGRTYYNVVHKGVVPYITCYYSRTLWASYAYNVTDAPMDVISQALGHKSGLKVTNFYVKRDNAKADAVNRALIDRLNEALAGRRGE